MDNEKTGKLIASLRKNKGLTQKELAEKLCVSDKAVSKWECGAGYPDVSMLNKLAEVLDINVNEILQGETVINQNTSGNMKKTKFYYCKICGNIITASTNDLVLSCCGSKLSELDGIKEDENHKIEIEYVEDDIFITIDHEMTKKHYISFIAYLTGDKLTLSKLYPEQNAQVRFKRYGHGIIYFYCSEHGMFKKII